jgi:hypothetical protein
MESNMSELLNRSTTSSENEHADSEANNNEKGEEIHSDIEEEEKAGGIEGGGYSTSKNAEAGALRDGRGRSRRSQDSRSLRTTRSHQSRAGGDGYICFDAEPENSRPNKSKIGTITGEPFLVTWDGDADSESPRSMSTFRRWVIVLICSASSLCV